MKERITGRKSVRISFGIIMCLCFLILPAGSYSRADDGKSGLNREITLDPTESVIDITGYSKKYDVVKYDNTNGLTSSGANAIAQTEDGFIWIGTDSGLSRTDGRTFELLDSTQGLSSVLSLFVDSSKRLWVGTNYDGIQVLYGNALRKYDGSQDIIKYNGPEGPKSQSVTSITEGSDGNIYFATKKGIGIVSSAGELSSVADPRIEGEYITVLKNSKDRVYGITRNGDVFTIAGGKVSGYWQASDFIYSEEIPAGDIISTGQIHTIFPDPENPDHFYAGNTMSGLFYCRIDNDKVYILQQTYIYEEWNAYTINEINLIYGLLVISSDRGICYINNGRSKEVLGDFTDFPIESTMVDYQGNIWLTTAKQGIFKLTPNSLSELFWEDRNLVNTVVNSTCIYRGTLLLGTDNRGILQKYESRVAEESDQESNYPDYVDFFEHTQFFDYFTNVENSELLEWDQPKTVHSFYEDSTGALWISGTGDYPLIRINGESAAAYVQNDGLPSNEVIAVTERADGNFAVACNGGLALISGTDEKVFRVYTAQDGLLSTELLTVTENNAGELIFGTDGGGLYILGKDGSLSHFGKDEGLTSDAVRKVKRDNTQDIIWIITGNSIAYMTPDHRITTVTGFPHAVNYDLFENKHGEMWILSSNGIYVVPKNELIENTEIGCRLYDGKSGLPYVATANSYSYADDGDLYIAGQKGVIKVDIDDFHSNTGSIKMGVPYLDADGVTVYPDGDGNFVLDSSVKKLTIHGYIFDHVLGEPVIRYRLDGVDSEDIVVTRSELVPVVYTNLDGGEYSFSMVITDPLSGYTDTATVKIIKKPAIYERLWFRIFMILALISLIAVIAALIMQQRIKVYRRKAEENRLFSREIVEAFAKVIDMKDHYTNGHSRRVAEYTVLLAEELGYDPNTVEKFRNIALMHDIGKVGVPPEVLNKPGKLTDEEFQTIKSHTVKGEETLEGISILPELADGAFSHHERPDGKGYPRGLTGDDIPRVAQIIGVADTFDAMYSNRPYRKRMNFDRAVSIIQENSGTQLTADVVDAFMRLVEKGKICPAEDDDGNGTTENIDNIRKAYNS